MENEKYYKIKGSDVTAIADSIREKINSDNKYSVSEMPEAIRSISTFIPEGYLKPEGDKEITENGQYDVSTYQTATVNVETRLPEQAKEIEIIENGIQEIEPDEGFVLNKVIVDVQVPDIPAKLQDKTVTPTKEAQEVTADNEFDGLGKVEINPIPEEYIVPEGTVNITNTDEFDVTEYATAKIKDDNLKAENIAEDIEVLGIKGTFRGGVDTNDGTATSSDILKGKTAYVKGEKIEGTIETYDYSIENGIVVPDTPIPEGEIYEGEYTITPSIQEQEMLTKNKIMKENVKIKSIPYYETSNNSDGLTVIIGGN